MLLSTILFSDRLSERKPITISREDLTRAIFCGRLLHCYRIYVDLGKALIDRASIGIKGPEYVAITSNYQEDLLRLVHEEHGVIMLSAHVGCWQAAMAQLHWLNTPVSLLLHRNEADVDRHYFEHSDIAVPFRIIDPLSDMGGVLEMMEVLKKGEIVSIMGDRVFGSDSKTVSVNFLGGKVRFPFSAFKLASATGAPVAVILSHNSGPGAYEMTLDKVIRVPSDLGMSEKAFYPYVAQFAEVLESYTKKYPYQFFNFYDMWESGKSVSIVAWGVEYGGCKSRNEKNLTLRPVTCTLGLAT